MPVVPRPVVVIPFLLALVALGGGATPATAQPDDIPCDLPPYRTTWGGVVSTSQGLHGEDFVDGARGEFQFGLFLEWAQFDEYGGQSIDDIRTFVADAEIAFSWDRSSTEDPTVRLVSVVGVRIPWSSVHFDDPPVGHADAQGFGDVLFFGSHRVRKPWILDWSFTLPTGDEERLLGLDDPLATVGLRRECELSEAWRFSPGLSYTQNFTDHDFSEVALDLAFAFDRTKYFWELGVEGRVETGGGADDDSRDAASAVDAHTRLSLAASDRIRLDFGVRVALDADEGLRSDVVPTFGVRILGPTPELRAATQPSAQR